MAGKSILIRPHHFLCLPGYVGKGYDEAHTNSWDRISQLVEKQPDLKVIIVEGRDTLCFNCPNNGQGSLICNEDFVSALDKKVKELLELKTHQIYNYRELLKKLRGLINPQKHKELCGRCFWRGQGLCKDTFERSKK